MIGKGGNEDRDANSCCIGNTMPYFVPNVSCECFLIIVEGKCDIQLIKIVQSPSRFVSHLTLEKTDLSSQVLHQ